MLQFMGPFLFGMFAADLATLAAYGYRLGLAASLATEGALALVCIVMSLRVRA